MSKIKELVKEKHKYFISLWRKIVMLKNEGNCVACSSLATEAHHIFSRGSTSWMAEYDPDNGIPLCNECHKELHDNRNDDIQLAIWEYLEEFGIDYDDLECRSKKSQKKSFENFESIENNLLSKNVIKKIIPCGIFEFEYNSEKRSCKKECGAAQRTDECQVSCKFYDCASFIVSIDGLEWARISANTISGKLGSEKMMTNGILRFFKKWGSLLDVSRNKGGENA
jgi:hypothetical protein